MIVIAGSRYPSEALCRFTSEVLGHLGLSDGDAAIGAAALIDADLAGIDTHGIANLATHAHYVEGLRTGQVDPQPNVTVVRDAPVAAAWDSGHGFGPVVAHRAMSTAIAKAESAGVGMVTVRRGRHFGANGYFAEMAAERGLMAMVTANTPVIGIPPGGLHPLVGTNPFAFAAPVGDGPPLIVDIAMTAVSGSKVAAARHAGDLVPEGWVVDADGTPSTDPGASRSGGGLELLGGQVAGHKGFGLALMVDALGMLAGNGSGIWQAAYSPDWSQGQWFAAWRVDLFIDAQEFGAEMRRVADHIAGAGTKPGFRVLLPGARRAACRTERASRGIPLADEVVEPLRRLASEMGVTFPERVRE